MAKQMSFVSSMGVTLSSSYWCPVQFIFDKLNKTARIVFHGYADAAARSATPIKEPIGFKEYNVSGDDFDHYFSPTILDTKNPTASAYQLADDTLDTDDKSFFDAAINV